MGAGGDSHESSICIYTKNINDSIGDTNATILKRSF
uniref:Uncharacterized protein n=1 Tax=Candidatus Berkiella aquae TaxID=295108 RepID=A0A0Q9YPP8_9GAMM